MELAPLSGFTIGIAADRRAGDQAELLRNKGARVVHGPTMHTQAVEPGPNFAALTRTLIQEPPELTVLSTGIGVGAWIDAAEAIGLGEDLVASLATSVVWARGRKARGAALTAGIPVDWHAVSGTSAEVVTALQREGIAGRRVAVQLDGAPASPVVDAVDALGGYTVPVRLYRWMLPVDTRPAARLIQAVCDGRVDAVTFTSRPQVENLFALAGDRADDVRAAFSSSVAAVCIGPVCAGAASAAGIPDAVVAPRARIGSLVMAVAELFAARVRDVDVGNLPVRLQGSAVEASGVVVELPPRERAVFDMLLERPGAVVSPARLRARVWRHDRADDHAVVVTVGRLRQRLAGTGITVENVHRRGYRVDLAADLVV